MTELQRKSVILLGVLGVSLSALLVRLGDCPAMVLVFYRMGLSALFTLPGALLSLGRQRGQGVCPLPAREAGLSLLSGLVLALHFYSYFAAVQRSSVASATVLVNTSVFFVALFLRLFEGMRVGRRGLWGMGAAFLGSLLIALGGAGAGGGTLGGDLLALLSALALALYTMLGRRCRKRLSTPLYTGLAYGGAALLALAQLCLSQTPLWGYGAGSLLAGLGMALFCTLMGHSLFSWGLKYLSPAFISTANLLEPLFASLLAFFLLGERPGLWVLLGGGAVVWGVGLYLRGDCPAG